MFSNIFPTDVYPGHLVSSAEVTAFELGEPLKKVCSSVCLLCKSYFQLSENSIAFSPSLRKI
jgi:hypothetical protein